MGDIARGLMRAKVMHHRLIPRKNRFVYRLFYLCLPLSRLADAPLRRERFGLFGFYNRDHGARDGSALEPWMRGQLARFDVPQADGEIVLMTLPRVLGHVFNPVSFWFCLDKAGALRAVLAEVNNTFRERHSYLVFHDDRRPIVPGETLESNKLFYVSPFFEVKGTYLFQFHYAQDQIGVWINYRTEEGMMLRTFVGGPRRMLTRGALLGEFFRIPLVSVKVIGLIHFQAVVLWLKRVRPVRHSAPAGEEISR